MKHDIIIMGLNSVKKDLTNAVSVAIIDDAIEVVKAHAELERDVKRYFELNEQAREKWGNGIDDKEAYELTQLHIKLSKAGEEE